MSTFTVGSAWTTASVSTSSSPASSTESWSTGVSPSGLSTSSLPTEVPLLRRQRMRRRRRWPTDADSRFCPANPHNPPPPRGKACLLISAPPEPSTHWLCSWQLGRNHLCRETIDTITQPQRYNSERCETYSKRCETFLSPLRERFPPTCKKPKLLELSKPFIERFQDLHFQDLQYFVHAWFGDEFINSLSRH